MNSLRFSQGTSLMVALTLFCAISVSLRAQMPSGKRISFGGVGATLLTANATRPTEPGSTSLTGLSSLPPDAKGPISAALGKDDPSYWARANRGGFRVENPRHRLVIDFTRRGAEVRNETSRWGLETHAYGYGDAVLPMKYVLPSANGNRVEYRRDRVTEWYVNGPLGLEQGFTLAAPPGKANGQPLTVALALSGDFTASLESGATALKLTGNDGLAFLRYTGLKTRDATGRELRSWFELRDERLLLLRVDDRNAHFPLEVDPWVQQWEMSASDGGMNDNFGVSVAVSGGTAVVGAPQHGFYGGAAYVFVQNGGTWSEQSVLAAFDGAEGDYFGWSVGVSGGTAVVGAPYHTVGSNVQQGAAYVFVQNGGAWNVQAELTASDGAESDYFGWSVAVNGSIATVGAPDHAVGGVKQGTAYVFAQSGTVWSQQSELIASDGVALDNFGRSVAVSGKTAVVGAPYHSVGSNVQEGAAYVFVQSGTTWSQRAELTASGGTANDNFGWSVGLSGNTAVVGAPYHGSVQQGAAYVFAQSGTSWTQRAELTASDGASLDNFGWSVGVSGTTAIVGAPFHRVGSVQQGAAYLFVQSGTTWSQQSELTALDGAASDAFGSVALSGITAVVGAPNKQIGSNPGQGAAYVFEQSGGTWSLQAEATASDGANSDYFGWSVAVSGSTAVIGAPYKNVGSNFFQGRAYVFVQSGTTWLQQAELTASDGAADDFFGWSVAVNGSTIMVGAYGKNSDEGAAYVFEQSGTNWIQQAELTASDGAPNHIFGWSVAVGNGIVAVGAPGQYIPAYVGEAYVFEPSGTTWVQEAELIPTYPAEGGEGFGYSVAAGTGSVVVGAPFVTYGTGQDYGNVYLFGQAGASWSQIQSLVALDGAGGDSIGFSVAMTPGWIMAGAPYKQIGSNLYQGAAYLFAQNSADVWAQEAELIAPDGAANDRFGYSVGVGEGTAVAAAPYRNSGQGAAYVFGQDGASTWIQQATIIAPDGVAGDYFGYSTAVSDSTAVIGAYNRTVGSNRSQGTAYMFAPPLPTASLSPSSLSFGNVALGGSMAKTVKFTNNGMATLIISGISITAGTNFAISSSTCGVNLAAGKSCDVTVTFTPPYAGYMTGTLSFTNDAANSPQTASLSGTGVQQAMLTPITLTYAKQKVGTTSLAKKVTLTNNQTISLNSISFSVTGDFAVSATTCGASLAAKAKCTISLTFTPTQKGARTGQLNVSDTASNSPQTVSLTGTGD